jgi:outer membrane protein assembly factor BamB
LSAREQGYSPPTLIQIDARKELVIWDADSLNSLDPTSGKLNWSVPLAANFGMSIMAPRQAGNLLYVGGIVGKGVLLELTKDKAAAEIVYEVNPTKAISPVNATPIVDGDYMSGVDRDGQLRGVVLRTGERLWETFAATTGGRRENSGTAFLVKNGDRYFLFNEQGDLIIAKLTPRVTTKSAGLTSWNLRAKRLAGRSFGATRPSPRSACLPEMTRSWYVWS